MYANTSKNTGKLLVAIMAMALIAVGCAVVISEETSAATNVGSYDELITAIDDGATEITATGAIDLKADIDLTGITLDLGENGLQTNGHTVTGGTITGTAKQIIYPTAYTTSTFNDVTVIAEGDNAMYTMYAWYATIVLNGCNFTGGTLGFDNANGEYTISLLSGTYVEDVSYISSAGSREYIVGEDVIMDSSSRIGNTNLGYPSEDNWNQSGGTSTMDVPEDQIYITDSVTAGHNTDEEKEPIITVEPGANYNGPSNEFVDNQDSERLALSDSIIAVYDELPISGTAYIAGSNSTLTIPTGKVLRIMSGGTLDMAGNTLVVEGTLVIETGATVSNGGNIVLMRNGTFDNSGIIGAGRATTITAEVSGITDSYTGVGSVTIQNVSGMTFGFVNTTGTSDTPTYTLTVTGDLIAEDTVNSISVDGARIVGEMYVGQDVTLDIQSSDIYSGASITVDGALAANGKLTMHNGSEITVNGQIIGAINAVTGDYLSSDGEVGFLTEKYKDKIRQTTFTATATGGFVSGYTLSVGTYAFQKENTQEQMEAWTAQRLYLSGTLAYNAPYDATALPTQGQITLTGNGVQVAADVTVVIPNQMLINNTGSPITVLGTMQFDGRAVPGFEYVGSSYNVRTTGTNATTTGYVTTFANAMGAIATAEQQKVTVKGALDIDAEYTLAANQRLDISGAKVVVKNGGSLTLEARSIVTGTVENVEGVMTIMKPNGSNAPAMYSTIAEGTTEAGVSYTRYSGLQYALDNANPGETITVVGVTDIEGNLTIPAGVTVSGENTISIDGNLVIEETAKLVMVDNQNLLMTGLKSKVTVNGELDLIEGNIRFTQATATGADTALTSSVGKTTIPVNNPNNNSPNALNGVAYINESLQYVITSAEAAITAASAQDINKYVQVYGNITVGDVDLTVDMGVHGAADATFGNINMADGVSIVIAGKLTATVSAQTGVAGSETTSSVVLADAYGIEIEAGSSVDNQNVTTYELYIHNTANSRLVGGVTVSAGTVTVGCDDNSAVALTVDSTTANGETNYATLTVVSGATLAVPVNATLNVGEARNGAAAITVDGTLAVDEGTVAVGYGTSPVNNGNLVINGTMTVADTENVDIASGSVMTVAGTLDISSVEDEEGLVNVAGTLVVGEKITTMGGSTTGSVSGAISTDSGIVKVYNGASVEEAVIDADGNGVTGAGSTALYINGNLYATLYSSEAEITDTTLENEDFSIIGYDMVDDGINGYDIKDLVDWYTDAEMTTNVTGTSVEIANEDALYFKVNSSVVDVRVSVGSGISLYIDNVRYSSGETVSLAVGTHTVTATVNPGFTGDVTIQFNGQTVTGEFTITPEMASNTYEGTLTITATGNITQDATVIQGGNGGDDGLGLTDILLIILVVLIVIMAIMVALRMMRS